MVAIIEKLKANILDNDAEAVLEDLEQLEAEARSHVEVLKTILSPPVITEIHKMLVENLGVNQRFMQIRRGNHTPKSRAVMFIRGMKIGVGKSESMVQKGK